MFPRRQPVDSNRPPEWQTRFDNAVELMSSRPQPPWVIDRLTELRRALEEHHAAVERLDDATDEMVDRRERLSRQVLNTAADVELLSVQAQRSEFADDPGGSHLREHFARLQDDLEALESARREIDQL